VLNLYCFLYPRFYPRPNIKVLTTKIMDAIPVPWTEPDYQQIVISHARFEKTGNRIEPSHLNS
jgi:hypothetical protein